MKLTRGQLRRLITEAIKDISSEELKNIRSLAQQGPEAASMAIDLATTLADEEYDESKLLNLIAQKMVELMERGFAGFASRTFGSRGSNQERIAYVLDRFVPHDREHDNIIRDIQNIVRNVNQVVNNIIMKDPPDGGLMNSYDVEKAQFELVPVIKEYLDNPVELIAATYIATERLDDMYWNKIDPYQHAVDVINTILVEAQGHVWPMFVVFYIDGETTTWEWENKYDPRHRPGNLSDEAFDRLRAMKGYYFGVDPRYI